MRDITYSQVLEAVNKKDVHVLEYQGDDVVDVTDLMIGIKSGVERGGDEFEVHILLKRTITGDFEQVMAHPVYTGKGIALFIEDTLGKLGISYMAV